MMESMTYVLSLFSHYCVLMDRYRVNWDSDVPEITKSEDGKSFASCKGSITRHTYIHMKKRNQPDNTIRAVLEYFEGLQEKDV